MGPANDVLTNMPESHPLTAQLLLDTAGVVDHDTKKAVNLPLQLVGYAVSMIELPHRDTGEVQPVLRAVLLCEDAMTISSTSPGVLRVLRTLHRLYGVGPWTPPIKARITAHDTGNQKQYCVLEAEARTVAKKPTK